MRSYKPVFNITKRNDDVTVFLAGTIELGKADDWQKRVEVEISHLKVNVINPRRDVMDPDMPQNYDNPEFYQQCAWELNGLDKSDVIFMCFDPTCKSPISLLELGLYADSGKIMVVCPEGFWRKGNVDIVCEKYDIPLFEDIDSGIEYLKKLILSH